MAPLTPFVRTRHSTGGGSTSTNSGSASRNTPTALHGRSGLSNSVFNANEGPVTENSGRQPYVIQKRPRPLPEGDPDEAFGRVANASTSTSTASVGVGSSRWGDGLPAESSVSRRVRKEAKRSEILGLPAPETPLSQIRRPPRHTLAGTPLSDTTGTGTGPNTPFYSPGTPSQLSRSTIIPFDKELNRLDGEEANRQSARKGAAGQGGEGVAESPSKVGFARGLLNFASGAGSGVSGAGGSRMKKRKSIIRRRGIIDRLTTYPQYLFDEAASYLSDLTLPPESAPYIALTLHTLHLLIRAPLLTILLSAIPAPRRRRWGSSSTSDEENIFKDEKDTLGLGRYDDMLKAGAGKAVRFGLKGWFGFGTAGLWGALGGWLFFLILIGLSLANASYLFRSRRRYDMRFRQSQLDSPNARTVPVPRADELRQEESVGQPGWAKKSLGFVWMHVNPLNLVRVLRGKPPHIAQEEKDRAQTMMQSLNVWDPPEFNMVFFIYFSPIQVFLTQLIGYYHPFVSTICNIVITAQTVFIVKEFERLVKDRQILQREVMREYDEVFVYKKMFTTRVDAGVQTSQAEVIF